MEYLKIDRIQSEFDFVSIESLLMNKVSAELPELIHIPFNDETDELSLEELSNSPFSQADNKIQMNETVIMFFIIRYLN